MYVVSNRVTCIKDVKEVQIMALKLVFELQNYTMKDSTDLNFQQGNVEDSEVI